MKFPPLSDAMRLALLDHLGPGAQANAVHLDAAYAAMVRAAGGVAAPVTAWSYTNADGKTFLSQTDPATWHAHDREGFYNFQALAPVATSASSRTLANEWRRLALQFDGHRMQAIGLLRMVLAEVPKDSLGAMAKDIEDFLGAAPLSGEAVLRECIAALAATPSESRAEVRYRKLRAWYQRGGRRADIHPHGHCEATTDATFDAGVDQLPDAKTPQGSIEEAGLEAPQADTSRPTLSPADEVALIVAQRAERARRIYIAGPMTGLPEYNFPAFHAKAAELRASGWHVENPAEHGLVEGAQWDDYMRWDLARVATCGAIYLLPGWNDSKGASLEEHVGKILAMDFQGAVSNATERPVAIMRANDASIESVRTRGWKLHRCPDDEQCREAIGGGCAAGYCAHFEVKPDEQGVSRFPETRVVEACDAAPFANEKKIAGWRVEHEFFGPAFTHHQVQAELWTKEGRAVTPLVAQNPAAHLLVFEN